jgi:integrase
VGRGKIMPPISPRNVDSDERESAMNKEQDSGVWEWNVGKVSGLVRHKESGRYYSRYQLNGKRTMKALKTDVFSVAKLRHLDTLATAEAWRQTGKKAEAGTGTMGDLLKLAQEAHGSNTELSAKTKVNFRHCIDRMARYWPECFGHALASLKPETITNEVAERFVNFLHERAVWRRHKAKDVCRGYGAVTVNKTIEALHRVLRFAKSRGFILAVPFELEGHLASGGILKSEPHKRIAFPSMNKIRAVFVEMRTIQDDLPENQNELREYLVRRAAESADLAEFMAFTGARIQEAVTWKWEDERAETIFIRGTKTETSRDREVPKVAALRDLLAKMKARRLVEGRDLNGLAFTIKQCREALESACKRVGVDRWTHHTLRHLFATTCIEAGVDIPTVSRWLGHADGGALAMQTYGHLRQEHSLAQAAKVRFGEAA